jgi:hypothetical protein
MSRETSNKALPLRCTRATPVIPLACVYGCLRFDSPSCFVINFRISSAKSGRRFHRARKCTALRAELAAFRLRSSSLADLSAPEHNHRPGRVVDETRGDDLGWATFWRLPRHMTDVATRARWHPDFLD